MPENIRRTMFHWKLKPGRETELWPDFFLTLFLTVIDPRKCSISRRVPSFPYPILFQIRSQWIESVVADSRKAQKMGWKRFQSISVE